MKILIQTITITLILVLNLLQISHLEAQCHIDDWTTLKTICKSTNNNYQASESNLFYNQLSSNTTLSAGNCGSFNDNDFADLCITQVSNGTSATVVSEVIDIYNLPSGTLGVDGIGDVQVSMNATICNAGCANEVGNREISACIGSGGVLGGFSDMGADWTDINCINSGGYICITIDFLNGFSTLATGFDLQQTSNNGTSEGYEGTFGYVTAGKDANGNPLTDLPTVNLSNFCTYTNAEYISGIPISTHVGATGVGTFQSDDPNVGITNDCATSGQNGEDPGSGAGASQSLSAATANPNLGLSPTDIITQIKYVYFFHTATSTDCNGDGIGGVNSQVSASWSNINFCGPPSYSVFPGDCNTDGIVNMDDALYWGLAEGFTGAVRSNATTDCTPQVCPDWSKSVDGINSKHQDGDGNGIVDGQDLQVIVSNFGCVNNYTAPTYAANAPIYRIQPQGIINGKYQYDVYAENGTGAAAVAHGLVFTVTSEVVPISAVTMSTTGSSLNPDAEFAFIDGNQCHAVLTRTDGFDVICGAPIATFLVATSDIPVGIPFEIDITYGSKIKADATLDNITGASAFGMYNGIGPISTNLTLDASVTHEKCDALGEAIAIPSGGTTPYTYAWSTGASGAQVTNLASGSYTVTVSDANGLNQSLTLQINGQTPIYDANGNLLCGNLCPDYLAPSGVTGTGLYSADNTLDSDATILTGNTIQYKAGQAIKLDEGFTVQPNAEFSAEIEDCNEN